MSRRTAPQRWQTIATRATLTPALYRACAPFAIWPTRVERGNADRDIAATRQPTDRVMAEISSAAAGSAVLITGRSGSGKSSLLRAASAALARRSSVVRAESPIRPFDRRAIVDLFSSPDAALDLLAHVGLAEARLLPRRAADLSTGERDRLSLALAVDRALMAPRGDRWIIADEFGSTLDRLTAASLANAVRRWLERRGLSAGVRLLAATAHEDMPARLAPTALIHCVDPLAPPQVIHPQRRRPTRPAVRIEAGTIADYDRLSMHHYRAGRPATVTQVLRAVYRSRVVGVLTVSMPTRNGVWRQLAWPGRYVDADHRRALRRLNRDVRCISRVVVDPACRGLGLATRLVRTYLASPQTPATEAIAMMGRLCPFFERAGMTAYPLPVHQADQRLLDALEHAAIEPWRLLDGRPVSQSIRAPLRRWARDRRIEDGDDLPLAAGMRLLGTPVAYAHAAEERA